MAKVLLDPWLWAALLAQSALMSGIIKPGWLLVQGDTPHLFVGVAMFPKTTNAENISEEYFDALQNLRPRDFQLHAAGFVDNAAFFTPTAKPLGTCVANDLRQLILVATLLQEDEAETPRMPHHQACVCPNKKILNEVLGGRLSSASWSPNLGLLPI